MTIPLGDNDIVYVHESQYITYKDNMKVRGAYMNTNDFYEGRSGYVTMTYGEFKEKYPIAGRYKWKRYVPRPYN